MNQSQNRQIKITEGNLSEKIQPKCIKKQNKKVEQIAKIIWKKDGKSTLQIDLDNAKPN